VVPAGLLGDDLPDRECVIRLACAAARALGVVTRPDLIDYQRLGQFGVRALTSAAAASDIALAAGLVPVTIGSGAAAVAGWADPGALGGGGADGTAGPGPGRHRVTLLSTFDSLIWDRKRTLRMFGFQHSLEAYVPRARRVHGYFTMPLLARGRLLGRVDPARSGRTLVARQLSLDTPAAAEPMARALREAARWVGCDDVQLGRVDPPHLAPRLAAALS
jgi:uncharacterized protein